MGLLYLYTDPPLGKTNHVATHFLHRPTLGPRNTGGKKCKNSPVLHLQITALVLWRQYHCLANAFLYCTIATAHIHSKPGAWICVPLRDQLFQARITSHATVRSLHRGSGNAVRGRGMQFGRSGAASQQDRRSRTLTSTNTEGLFFVGNLVDWRA